MKSTQTIAITLTGILAVLVVGTMGVTTLEQSAMADTATTLAQIESINANIVCSTLYTQMGNLTLQINHESFNTSDLEEQAELLDEFVPLQISWTANQCTQVMESQN